MSQQTAKFILHKHGLSGFSTMELSDLLDDRYQPLPSDVKQAILTIKNRLIQKPTNSTGEHKMTIYKNQTPEQAFKIAKEAHEAGQLFDFSDGNKRKTVDVIVYDNTTTYTK